MTAPTEAPSAMAPYRPEVPISISPIFDWPPRPIATVSYFLRNTLWPLGLCCIGVAVLILYLLTPSLETMATLDAAWIAIIWARNAALLTVVAGSLHYVLYRRRRQGTEFKYNERWLAMDSAKFSFGSQLRDNVFWSIASGVTVWTGYEAITWWLYATGRTTLLSWSDDWLYLTLLTLAMFLWSVTHFYLNHRLLHWDPLYRSAHALHHRNVNTGPWSGISMHPLEHLVYFSAPVLLWFIPGHPVAALTLLVFSGVSPAFSHAGFDRIRLGGDSTTGSGDYFHHVHHRYFECNYGNRPVPLDKLFGTFHDGTPEAHERMRERRRARIQPIRSAEQRDTQLT